MIVQTKAIIIRCIDYSNTSQIATLFTERCGKISLIAKGARRTGKTQHASVLGVLQSVSVVCYQKRPEHLAVLKEHNLQDHYPKIRRDLGRIFAALYWLELVRECTNDWEENPAIFEILESGLSEMGEAPAPENLFFATHWRILDALGLAPHVGNCAMCGALWNETGPWVRFSASKGGCLCEKCRRTSAPNERGEHARISALACWKISALLDPERAGSIRLNLREYREIYLLFRSCVRTILHKDLRLGKYLMNGRG